MVPVTVKSVVITSVAVIVSLVMLVVLMSFAVTETTPLNDLLVKELCPDKELIDYYMAGYQSDIPVEDAKLSAGAYGGKQVDGYTIDKQLSSPDRTAYVDPEGNVTLAFRGTNLKDPSTRFRDIGTDLLLTMGLQGVSSRFKHATQATDSAIAKYGRDKVRVTGHSLGGAESLYVSNKRGVSATALNPGVSPIDAMRNRTYTKARSYTTFTDPISMLSRKVKGLKTTIVKQKSSNPHSLANFLFV